MLPESTVQFLPSLGVWGTDDKPLIVPCKKHIDNLKIVINAHGKEFLNIQGIEVFGQQGENLLHSTNFKHAEISSNFFDDTEHSTNVKDRILNSKMLHSKLELNPALSLDFAKATYVDCIIVKNRSGMYGYRSRFISIEAYVNGTKTFQFDNIDSTKTFSAKELFNVLYAQTKFQFLRQLPLNIENKLRNSVKWLLSLAAKSEAFDRYVSEKLGASTSIVTPKNTNFAQRYVRKQVFNALNNNMTVSTSLKEDLLPFNDPFPSFDSFCAQYLCEKIDTLFQQREEIPTQEIPSFKSLIKNEIERKALVHYANEQYSPFLSRNIKISINEDHSLIKLSSATCSPNCHDLERVANDNAQDITKWKPHIERELRRSERFNNLSTKFVAWSQCIEKENRPPSNTLFMIKQAIEHAYQVIELDLRVTKDCKIVLAHDDILKNDSGDQITLSNSSIDEAKHFCIGEFNGRACYLNCLDEALPLLKGRKILLDARFKSNEYKFLKEYIRAHEVEEQDLIFCVYNIEQAKSLISHFPDSLLFWKFYTQLWEIDFLIVRQLRMLGIDGIMYLTPHYNERFDVYLKELKQIGLQSLCFIHGEEWTPEQSVGLTDCLQKRGKDNFDKSLQRLINVGIEYVTTTRYESVIFQDIVHKANDKLIKE